MATKQVNNIDQKSKARELIGIIKSKFVNQDGLLARNFPVDKKTLFSDFDDIVPFFIYFKETDFLLLQIKKIIKKSLTIKELCGEDGVLVSRNIDEWIGGLYTLWKETKDKDTFRLLKKSVDFILHNLFNNGFLSAAYFYNKKKPALFYESWSAGLLEVFIEARDEFPKAFIRTKQVLTAWAKSKYFQKYSIFPYRVYQSRFLSFIQKYVLLYFFPILSYSKPNLLAGDKNVLKSLLKKLIFVFTNGYYSQLMKSNSTTAFALLEMYRATGKDFWLNNLLKWIDGAVSSFYNNGMIYMEYNPKTGRKRHAIASAGFILSDVLCDTVYFGKKVISEQKKGKMLKIVRTILDFNWDNRIKSGLIPRFAGGNFAHIDDQVDFSISIRRYAQLSGKKDYLDRSVKLMFYVLKEHYSKNGYYTYSGNKKDFSIDPKYNALLLKGLINLDTINKPLYPKLHSLFKDR